MSLEVYRERIHFSLLRISPNNNKYDIKRGFKIRTSVKKKSINIYTGCKRYTDKAKGKFRNRLKKVLLEYSFEKLSIDNQGDWDPKLTHWLGVKFFFELLYEFRNILKINRFYNTYRLKKYVADHINFEKVYKIGFNTLSATYNLCGEENKAGFPVLNYICSNIIPYLTKTQKNILCLHINYEDAGQVLHKENDTEVINISLISKRYSLIPDRRKLRCMFTRINIFKTFNIKIEVLFCYKDKHHFEEILKALLPTNIDDIVTIKLHAFMTYTKRLKDLVFAFHLAKPKQCHPLFRFNNKYHLGDLHFWYNWLYKHNKQYYLYSRFYFGDISSKQENLDFWGKLDFYDSGSRNRFSTDRVEFIEHAILDLDARRGNIEKIVSLADT